MTAPPLPRRFLPANYKRGRLNEIKKDEKSSRSASCVCSLQTVVMSLTGSDDVSHRKSRRFFTVQ